MRMGRSHLINRCKFHERIKGFFEKCLTSRSSRSISTLRQIDLNFTSRSTTILHPDRPQLHVQIDLNFTSRSTAISHSDWPQFHLQIDLNFMSRSTSMSRPDRPQCHIKIDLSLKCTKTCDKLCFQRNSLIVASPSDGAPQAVPVAKNYRRL